MRSTQPGDVGPLAKADVNYLKTPTDMGMRLRDLMSRLITPQSASISLPLLTW